DKGGNISEKSDTVNYNLIEAPDQLNYNVSENCFTWDWPGMAPPNIIFRIEESPFNGEPYYIKKIGSSGDGIVDNYYDTPTIYLNNLNENFTHGQLYRFRIDIYENEYKGSESKWQSFQTTK
ncbi:MAG: hypothetical protein KAR38_16485, partial [Calditrichia bacterium]|nr:hypothetical protein [Calditrichia bacterium]